MKKGVTLKRFFPIFSTNSIGGLSTLKGSKKEFWSIVHKLSNKEFLPEVIELGNNGIFYIGKFVDEELDLEYQKISDFAIPRFHKELKSVYTIEEPTPRKDFSLPKRKF